MPLAKLRKNLLIKTIWALLRPQTYLLLIIYVIFGFTYGLVIKDNVNYQVDTNQIINLILVCVALAAWYVNGTALNDFADYEIDKINLKGNKQRPLLVGLASRQ